MDFFSIGEISKLTGIPSKTIRFYEEINLLNKPKRLDNKYRAFSKNDLERLNLIKEAKSLGMPLDDIKQLIHLCQSEGCENANAFLKQQVPLYLKEVENRIKELESLREKLKRESSKAVNTKTCAICSNC